MTFDQKSSKLNSRPVCCSQLYGIMIQSLVIMWQCVPLLKRNVCSTEINPPAKIFGTHTSVALRLQASSIFNKTKNRHFRWNSDATQRRYLRQHDGVLFYFLTLQFNIEYENTPIISYGKKTSILDRDKPKEQLFSMVKIQTTHVKLLTFNRIL